MDNCPRCGEALGPAAGRYCINCGQRVDGALPPEEQPVEEYADWRTDTFERSVVPMSPQEPTRSLPPVPPSAGLHCTAGRPSVRVRLPGDAPVPVAASPPLPSLPRSA